MICGTTLERTIELHKPAGAEMYGATVAINNLIAATLQVEHRLTWDIWTFTLGSKLAS